MIKILVNDGLHADGKMLLEEAGYEVDDRKVAQADLLQVLPNYDAVIVRSATHIKREVLEHCPNLKLIARAGVGMDNIDTAFARERGVKIMTARRAVAHSVAELAFGHMFTLARHFQNTNRDMPSKGNTAFKELKEAYSNGIQLKGKNLGIIGFGKIGQEVARIGIGIGMNIIPVDLEVNEVEIDVSLYRTASMSLAVKMTTTSLQEMLPEADFVTLHVPLNGDTPILGAKEIAMMKKGAFLINTSRGGTVDEEAMIKALDSGKLAGAGLDVYNQEANIQEALLQHPKISMTPHTGAATIEAQRDVALELADKIIAFFGDQR